MIRFDSDLFGDAIGFKIDYFSQNNSRFKINFPLTCHESRWMKTYRLHSPTTVQTWNGKMDESFYS